MEAFIKVAGTTMPIDRPNVDTDAIIPKQFLKSIKRSGFGPNLFDEWRYLDQGEPGMDVSTRSPNPEFIMNQARYQGAQIMLARDNFGCGSSREHAVWALEDAGFKVVIAPSFADIFFNNCFKNGVLPIVQPTDVVDRLFDESYATAGYALVVDLPTQKITLPDGSQYGFEVDAFRKTALLEGLDDIGQTLKVVDDIKNYERKRRESAPWLFDVIGQS